MDFLTPLEANPLVVGDGAMGSQLMARGLEPGECGDLWSVDRPDLVVEVQRAYVEAGADYVLTNTFGANGIALEKYGLAGRVEEINAAAVEVARRACQGRALVVGDMGPSGELLEPYGDLTEDDVRVAFALQVEALVGAGVDALICETFESSAELRVVLGAARAGSELPLIASMKFAPEPSGRYRSMMGEGPEELLHVAEGFGCAAVGTNCGQGIETLAPLVGELSDLTELPIIVQPNAGMPQLAEGRTVYPEDSSVFARCLPDVYEAGARIIGGCCGTTVEHIRAIRQFADSL
jgi:5-methyltetrahydrofolate--homocysteine methyltransferase